MTASRTWSCQYRTGPDEAGRHGLRQPPQLLNRIVGRARAACSAAVRAAIAWLFMT
jgi:hypothetical protein